MCGVQQMVRNFVIQVISIDDYEFLFSRDEKGTDQGLFKVFSSHLPQMTNEIGK
jgi:hypothetical protein